MSENSNVVIKHVAIAYSIISNENLIDSILRSCNTIRIFSCLTNCLFLISDVRQSVNHFWRNNNISLFVCLLISRIHLRHFIQVGFYISLMSLFFFSIYRTQIYNYKKYTIKSVLQLFHKCTILYIWLSKAVPFIVQDNQSSAKVTCLYPSK